MRARGGRAPSSPRPPTLPGSSSCRRRTCHGPSTRSGKLGSRSRLRPSPPRTRTAGAAAVVLTEGSELDEKAIRAFTAEHVADFKVPRSVIILEEIPKGATGKIQRIGMAEKLGLTG